MFKISNISQKNISTIFLGIFLSFLVISITHSHNYQIISAEGNFSAKNDSYLTDQYLDNELNCLIHSFSNSIFSGIANAESLVAYSTKENIYRTISISHLSSELQFSNHLRAPPLKVS